MPSVSAAPANIKKHGVEKPSERSSTKSIEKSSEKSNEKAKNVSHVPCKFYRQSICQAGDKCPFSHEMETDSQAVCKYFQKGNCKFGTKCALAHITPDGRHVNKKTGKERKKERYRDEKKTSGSIKETEDNTPSPKITQLSANGFGLSSPQSFGSGYETLRGQRKSSGSQSSDATLAEHSVELASQYLLKYSGSGSPPVKRPSKSFGIRAFSASLPHRGNIAWGNVNNFMAFAEGSAIADDDDDNTIEEKANKSGKAISESEEEEEGYQEQLVPSALQDLLTPLERERRNSRTSQPKTARVNSSPASTSNPLGLSTRRGSTGSEHIASISNMSLWGPRTTVAPFYRNGAFGSPPMNAAQSPPISHMNLMSPPISHQPFQFTSLSSNEISSEKSSVASRPNVHPLLNNQSHENVYRPFQQYSRVVPTEKL